MAGRKPKRSSASASRSRFASPSAKPKKSGAGKGRSGGMHGPFDGQGPKAPSKNKALGQHFLRAESDADRVAGGLADWPLDAPVLEVGPGGGALTRALLDRMKGPKAKREAPHMDPEAVKPFAPSDHAPPLWCCEKDDRFAERLVERFPALSGRMLRQDFLRMDPSALPAGDFALAGNFPYNISSQIVFRVLEWRDRVPLMVGMFQKEVADRICAAPGNKARGVLSVLTEAYFEREWLFDLPPEAFDPPPKVHSSVIRLRRKAIPDAAGQDRQPAYPALARVVKAAFAMRRKKLRNCLKGWALLDPDADAEARLESLLDQRAEQLDLEAFLFLAERLSPKS